MATTSTDQTSPSTTTAETPEEMQVEIEEEAPDPLDIEDPGIEWIEPAPLKGEKPEEKDEQPDEGEDDDVVVEDEEEPDDAIEIDDELLTAAVKAGFDIPTARKFGSANALAAAIDVVEKRVAEIGQPAKSDEEDEAELDIGLDPDVYEPEIVNAIKKVHKASRSEIKELNKQVKTLLNQIGEQQETAALREFDTQLKSLGDTFAKDIGNGSTTELDKRSKAFKTRMQIRDLRDTLRKSMKLSSDEAFRRAYVGVLGDRVKSEARDEVRQEVKKRRRQAVSRPVVDNGVRELSAEKVAVANLTKRMREAGMMVDEEMDNL